MDDNQMDWLEVYLESDDVAHQHDRLINWIDKLVYDAIQAEHLADARAVCPRCAAGDAPLRPDGLHEYPLPGYGVMVIACKAAPIWARGQAESERA